MNAKKFVSFISAAALTAGCFGGISVQAKETTAEIGRIYNSNEIFPASGNTETITINSSMKDYYDNTLKAPFGDFEEINNTKFPKQTSANSTNTYINDTDGSGSSLKYTVSTEGNYTFSVFVLEYDNRYPNIYVDGVQKIDGNHLSGLYNYSIGTYGTNGQKLAIIQVPLENLSAGTHTIKFSNDDQVRGVIAAVLTDDNAANPTETPAATTEPQSQAVTYRYSAANGDIINGRTMSIDSEVEFVSGVNENIASFFADDTDSTKLLPELVKSKKDFIGGKASNSSHPMIKVSSLPAGNYKLYYLGYNNEKPIKVSFEKAGKEFSSVDGAQVQFARLSSHTEQILKLYEIDIKIDSDVTDETMTFDTATDANYLPDLFSVVLTNQEKYSTTPSETATPAPTIVPGSAFTSTYKADGSSISTGRVNDTGNNDKYILADGMDDIVYDIFEDKTDTSRVNPELIKKYINYIGVGGSSQGNPQIKGLNFPAGNYKIYYIGQNNENTGIKASIGNITGETKDKVLFAKGDKELKLFTIDLAIPEAITNGTLEFSALTDYWLPDLYAAAITNEANPISVSGTISSDDNYDYNGTNIIFTSKHGKEYKTAVGDGNSFELTANAGTYTASTDDIYHVINGTYTISSETSKLDIKAENETSKNVAVNLINPPAEGTVITLGGENIEFTPGETSKNVVLNPGKYAVSSSNGTISELSKTELTVAHEDTYKNIYYPETIVPATSQNIRVDKTAAAGENVYNSISDALYAAKAGNISAPIITVTSGQTYQEQVKIDMPNVTIKTSGEEKATITWYYGVGQAYYSIGEDGTYNKDRAMTKVGYVLDKDQSNPNDAKKPVLVGAARWGGTVFVSRYGSNFKLENITVVNSFNKEVTALELEDGVTPNNTQNSGQTDRTVPGFNANSSSNVERAAAIVFVDGPTGCEMYNSDFISSQDTMFTTGSVYFNNCKIQGNVDYIFGGGHIVFDDCRLVWNSFKDGKSGGYITAASSGDGEKYIFRNCTIENDGTTGGGCLGRDWRSTASVYYFNLKDNSGNTELHWSDMGGGVKAETADLHAYDFDLEKNKAYSTTGSSGANVNGLLTFEQAREIYEGAIDSLGFTPSTMINAKSSAVTEGEADTDNSDYVYGIVTTVKSGENSAVSGIKWTITDGKDTYTATSSDAVNGEGLGVAGDKLPTVSGGMEASFAMLFHAPKGTYNVVSDAE